MAPRVIADLYTCGTIAKHRIGELNDAREREWRSRELSPHLYWECAGRISHTFRSRPPKAATTAVITAKASQKITRPNRNNRVSIRLPRRHSPPFRPNRSAKSISASHLRGQESPRRQSLISTGSSTTESLFASPSHHGGHSEGSFVSGHGPSAFER